MKKFIYYTKEGKFEAEYSRYIPLTKLHSPNEEIPALIYPTGKKVWFYEGLEHRLTGPAIIWDNGVEWFYLNGNRYEFEEWILNHPNIELYLDAQGMNEAEKALWKLKNL